MRNYDEMSKEDLIMELDKLRAELLIARSECKRLTEEVREISSEKPGYKWRWSDERFVTRKHDITDLEQTIEQILKAQSKIRSELEFIKIANHGGTELERNYYKDYDEELYLKELNKKGFIVGFII